MMEGTSLRAITRLMDIDLETVLSLLETTGQQCRRVFDTYVRGMRSDFVQADEIHTTVGCHQRRLRLDAPSERGDAYTWIAIDSTTRMILSYYVGRRDADSANAFMRDLSQRVDGRFQLTTDGFRPYVNAVEAKLKFAVHIFMAWFCLCRVHQTLRVTPAMEARLTDHIWAMEELICHGSLQVS